MHGPISAQPAFRGETAIIDTISALTAPGTAVVATGALAGKMPNMTDVGADPSEHRADTGAGVDQTGWRDCLVAQAVVRPSRTFPAGRSRCECGPGCARRLPVRHTDLHEVGHDLALHVVEVRYDRQRGLARKHRDEAGCRRVRDRHVDRDGAAALVGTSMARVSPAARFPRPGVSRRDVSVPADGSASDPAAVV